MPTDSPSEDDRRPPETRSRITNGRDLLPDIDHRTTWARRFRDLIDAYAQDQGGADLISEAQRSLIRRASALEVEAEHIETKMAQRTASPDDMDLYLRLTGVMKRLFDSLGLERRARNVTPDLDDYLQGKLTEAGSQ